MLKIKRFVFMVLIVSFISVFSAAALALTAREEKLIDICKRYEDWFASHARSYGKTLPMGAGHLEFTCYRVPQTYTDKFSEKDGLIAKIKSGGWASNNGLYMELYTEDSKVLGRTGLSFSAGNPIDGDTRAAIQYAPNDSYGYYNFAARYVRAEVSESSPNAGTMRQIAGSLFNFGSWVTDVDDGAFVVIKYSGGVKNGEAAAFFKTDCTECANIMARFLNDIFPVMASE